MFHYTEGLRFVFTQNCPFTSTDYCDNQMDIFEGQLAKTFIKYRNLCKCSSKSSEDNQMVKNLWKEIDQLYKQDTAWRHVQLFVDVVVGREHGLAGQHRKTALTLAHYCARLFEMVVVCDKFAPNVQILKGVCQLSLYNKKCLIVVKEVKFCTVVKKWGHQ